MIKYIDKEIFVFAHNTGCHFAVLIVEKSINKIFYLDPLKKIKMPDFFTKFIKILKADKIIQADAKIVEIDRSFQKDSWSCGYFVLLVTI